MTTNPRASFRCGVLTLSDKGARGERDDTSGPELQTMLRAAGFSLAEYRIIADEQRLIEDTLTEWADSLQLDLIVTTGGTGVSPRDRTPEATRNVIDREVPGLAEAMRLASLAVTPQAVWSRAMAGIRGTTLILNLPGSKKAARENLAAVLPALVHGLEKIQGSQKDCVAEPGPSA
jgi:molybdopterin adenylyltransferase